MIKAWRKSLLVQIVGSFSVLSFGIIVLVGCLAFVQARQSLKQSMFERLTTVASLKEGEINRWLSDRQSTLISLYQITAIQRDSRTLLTAEKSSDAYQQASQNLQAALTGFAHAQADYREFFILSRGGRILVSTNADNIGKYLPRDQSSETVQGIGNQTFISNFYASTDTGLPTVTLITPILDEASQQRLGTLSAHLVLDRADEITQDVEGMGQTGESYLVADVGSAFSEEYVFASADAFRADEFPEGISSPGIEAAMNGDRGRGLYPNYAGIPTVGVYHWLEAQNVALIVEMEQSEAFSLAHQLARSILAIGLAIAGLMLVGIVLLGRQIVTPILNISTTANDASQQISEGKLSMLATTSVSSENEIGTLANAFNRMIGHVSLTYEKLQEKHRSLNAALEELKQTQLQMVQSEKMAGLGQMVAGIAHEVNNPAGFVHGNLKYLEQDVKSLFDLIELYASEYPNETVAIRQMKEEIDIDFLREDLPKLFNSMSIGTARIREIVRSMRNFSRLDESERKPANLREGIEGTLLILQHRLKAQTERAEIEVITDYGDLPNIECYPGQLNQVFLNLISNAIDAFEEHTVGDSEAQMTIRIQTALRGQQAVITVSDNGVGIPDSVRQRIFEPFFTTKAVGKGTGLGLSISYAVIVKHHKGELVCHSELGKGTEFVITIPIQDGDARSPGLAAPSYAQPVAV